MLDPDEFYHTSERYNDLIDKLFKAPFGVPYPKNHNRD